MNPIKTAVLMRNLGLLSTQTATLVDEAAEQSSIVRLYQAEVDGEEVPEAFEDLAAQLTRPITYAVTLEQKTPITINEKVLELFQAPGVLRGPELRFEYPLGAAPKTPKKREKTSDKIVDCHQDRISIQAPVDLIPHGLCWLMLQESDGTLTPYLPELELIDEVWMFSETIETILDGRKPDGPVTPYIVPANSKTRELFATAEVHRFWQGLSEGVLQRQLAQQFFEFEPPDEQN
jgi:hypothetical protein